MRRLALSDEILLRVEKPARYIGGEINMIKKDPEQVDIRFCMCFPDVYEGLCPDDKAIPCGLGNIYFYRFMG